MYINILKIVYASHLAKTRGEAYENKNSNFFDSVNSNSFGNSSISISKAARAHF